MIGAATLGFLTKDKLVALHTKYEETEQARKTAVSEREEQRKQKEAALAAEAEAKKAAEEATARAIASEAAKREADAKVAAVTADLNSLKEQIAQLTASGTGGAGGGLGEIENLKTQLAEAQQKQVENETKLKEAETLVATLSDKVRVTEDSLKVLQEEKAKRERGFIAKGLEGQVLAVNQGWNFVVLSIGDRQGLLPNAQMVVLRNGEMIAKLKVTSVEKGTSIADIVPGTTSRGARVMPGDRVIYPGS
jgi:seryl-tRNA synthetase